MVWSIDRSDGRGGVQTLHVVIEHQSSVDYSMPLRFLNYTSLLYQRLYRDRITWSRDDRADPVLHVVVYNGGKRWDAPLTLAGLVERTERDGPAQLAVSYDVVDLVAVTADDLPRANLLRWVAGGGAGCADGRVAGAGAGVGGMACGSGRTGADEELRPVAWRPGPEVGRGVAVDREYEEVSAVLLEKIDRWEAEILEQGIERGRQEGQLGTIEKLVRAGVAWTTIEAATGIDERTFDRLKHQLDAAADGDSDAT